MSLGSLFIKKRVFNFSAALLILFSQLLFSFVFATTTSAAGQITLGAQFENQTFPNNSNIWTNGQLDNYSEGDYVNFRFQLNANDATAAGVMQIELDLGACNFFTNYFNIVSTTPSIASVNKGAQTLVNPSGNNNDYYKQLLNVNFNASGTTTVVFTLQLSNTAGECTGSNVGVRLGVPAQASGDFANAGAKTLPMSANSVLENPSLTITKTVQGGSALASDFYFTFSPAINGVTEIHIPNGQSSVTINEVNPDGVFTITEHGPIGYSFAGGTGTNCVASSSTGVMTATVQALASNPKNATCNFTNEVDKGSITIVKNAVPNDGQDFTFTTTVTGVEGFTLDDDSDDTLSKQKKFSDLTAGTYTFTESSTNGWYLDAIDCPDIDETKNLLTREVSLTIAAGQNITCTFTNRKLGQIIVTKQTQPDGDQTQFNINASPADGVVGDAAQTIADDETETYIVKHGTYAVNETVPADWSQISNNCSSLVINGVTPLDNNGIPTRTCTINNTKLGSIQIIKDAVPNHEQDFQFSAPNFGQDGLSFYLDDDDNATLSNSSTFTQLLPGTYNVTEVAATGWKLTNLECDNEVIDSATAQISLAAGENVVCTFTNTKLVKIAGTKFEADADKLPGVGLGAWKIILDLDDSGDVSDGDRETVTEADGSYLFENVLYGTNVILFEILKDGWTQMFAPEDFTINSVDDVTGLDFGNFRNATISGYKWNDLDGNRQDDNEPKLNGWTINLKDDNDVLVDSKVTSNGGAYSFTDLAPGDYSVCEDISSQVGWTQTFPAQNRCHSITIDISGEVETANFGNQGRGSISVIKNVDSDGDGDIDFQDVDNWTWDIDGNGDFATGSGNSRPVAAGDYTVSEDQLDDYHVSASSCSGEDTPRIASESLSVNVSAGESVVCTYTNTRDTGTLEIIKIIAPETDDGLFDLNIGDATYKNDASNLDTTDDVLLPTGEYDISETAGTNTNLDDYFSEYECYSQNEEILSNQKYIGVGTQINDVVVEKDSKITCVFTNEKYSQVKVTKFNDYDRDGEKDDNEPNLADWGMNLVSVEQECDDEFFNDEVFSLLRVIINDIPSCGGSYTYNESQSTGSDGTTIFERVRPFSHTLSETQQEDWTLSNIYCGLFDKASINDTNEYLIDDEVISPGQTLECFVGNYRDSELTLEKSNNQTRTGSPGDIVTYTLTVTVPDDVDEVFDAEVVDLPPENVDVLEGTETASSNMPGSQVASRVASSGGPQYASPGHWTLGDLAPGEVVTLTYQAQISRTISSGVYPDIAYATAYDDPENNFALLANADAPEPFVASDIAVAAPKPPTLANTGSKLQLMQFVLPIVAIITAAALLPRQKKGGRA